MGGAALCLGMVASTASANADTLTLQQTVRYALTHNPTVAAKQAALAQAESAYTKNHAALFPPVVAGLQNEMSRQNNFSGNLAQFGVAPVTIFSQNTAQVGTQWTFYNGSLNQILSQQAKRQVEAARADLRQIEAQTTTTLVNMFFTIANRQNALDLAQSNLTYQRVLLAVAQAKEKTGLVAGVEVLRADVAVAQSQVSVLSTRSDEETARESLAQAIGAALDTKFAIPAELPEPPLPAESTETLVRIAQINRPDIAVAAANVSIAQLSRASIDTDLLPQVSLNASFGNQTSPTSFVDQQNTINQLNAQCALFPNSINCIGAPFPNVARGTPGFWSIGAVSTLSLPLIDYGARAASHRAASKSIESAQLNLASTRTAAEGDVLQSLRGAQTAHETLYYQRRAVDLAVESARIAQLQYRNGLISLTDATATQQTSLQAQSDLFNARIAYINAVVRLRSALGTFDPLATVADL